MGALGPDVFPDPIVGQTTTHPGVEGGWQADEWLEHLLNRSTTAEELAFSYGFIVHGAGDIFAHTYVNAYAGDIFSLTDDEREVELRHFVLEKYIESKTPTPLGLTGVAIDWENDFGTATSFARDALIMDSDVSRENARAGTGYHLTAMFQVRERVTDLERAVEKIVSQLTSWGQKYFAEELKLQSGLTSAKLTLEAASLALDGAEELLRLKNEFVKVQLAALERAKDIVIKHPELITAQQKLLFEQIKVVADAVAEAARIANEVQNTITGAENAIGELRGRLGQFALPHPRLSARRQGMQRQGQQGQSKNTRMAE